MILNISYTAFFDFFQYNTVEFLFPHPLHPFPFQIIHFGRGNS